MNDRPFKILMFGPAYGHNMKPFIEFFETNNHYNLTYAYSGRNDFEKPNQRIKFVSYSKNPINLLSLIFKIRKDYDLIWNQGGYNILIMLLIYCFGKKRAIKSTNIWGEKIPKISSENTFRGSLSRFFLKKSTVVHCNWYGTRNILKNIIDEEKLVVFPPGMHASIFQNEETRVSKQTEDFIKQLPNDKLKFFYPKSITEASDHDCIIEAVKLLSDKGINNFCVYFWSGNVSVEAIEDKVTKKIDAYNLQSLIKLEKHNFLPFSDFKVIWEQMDCGLQISITDQLSFTLLEPMVSKKDLIATNIEPYQILSNKFPELELDLIDRTPMFLAKRMESFINGNRVSESVLNSRRKTIEREFNFENNLNKMMDYYKQLSKKKSN